MNLADPKQDATCLGNTISGGVREARFATPLGEMVALLGPAGVMLLDFHDRRGLADAMERRRQHVAGSQVLDTGAVDVDELEIRIRGQLADYFSGARLTIDVPTSPLGTPFEKKAWEYLNTIPPGRTRTYAQQAVALGSPGAARAVGRANGMNFLCLIIPCHRVVGTTGDLTGFGGGVKRKAWLLDHERRHTNHVDAELFDAP